MSVSGCQYMFQLLLDKTNQVDEHFYIKDYCSWNAGTSAYQNFLLFDNLIIKVNTNTWNENLQATQFVNAPNSNYENKPEDIESGIEMRIEIGLKQSMIKTIKLYVPD